MKANNYNKYWKNWNVLQTPKIDLDLLSKEDDWEVYDSNLKDICTVAKRGDLTLKVTYSYTGGVNHIEVTKGDKKLYNQTFSFLLKPSVDEMKKIIKLLDLDFDKFYTAC